MKSPESFDDFRILASDKKLKFNQKVDFPKRKTEKQIDNIIEDWKTKLPDLKKPNKIILDLGCGCQLVNRLWLELSERSRLILVDSQEMLDNVEDLDRIEKLSGKFPDIDKLFKKYSKKIDMIVAYSVAQYVYSEGGVAILNDFIDCALALLKPGGRLLLGDIPNKNKAERFFYTTEGRNFHKKVNKTNKNPEVVITDKDITDKVILDIVETYRYNMNNVYVVPQSDNLLFANTREDILFIKRKE